MSDIAATANATPVWSYSAPVSSIEALAEVSVPTGTATAITSSTTEPREVLLSAPSTNTVVVYIGPSGVTTTTGTPIAPGDRLSIAIDDARKVYSIAASSGQKLRVLLATARRVP